MKAADATLAPRAVGWQGLKHTTNQIRDTLAGDTLGLTGYVGRDTLANMPALNIRDVPEDLMRQFKVEAAQCGMNLRGWVLTALKGALPILLTSDEPTVAQGITATDILYGRPTEAVFTNASTPCECPGCESKRWHEAKRSPDATAGDSQGYIEDRTAGAQ